MVASSKGAITGAVSCPRSARSCAGSLTLKSTTAVGVIASASQAKKRKTVTLTLAVGSFKILGGHAATVTMHLTTKARKLLARVHVIRAIATLIVHKLPTATRTTHETVTIREGGRPGRHIAHGEAAG